MKLPSSYVYFLPISISMLKSRKRDTTLGEGVRPSNGIKREIYPVLDSSASRNGSRMGG